MSEDMEERDYTQEAKEQGWNENFDGPNKVDAKVFVERGEKIAGILKSKVERLENKVDNLTESNRQFGEYHKQTLEKQRQSDATKIADLKAQVAQAVTDGDGQAYTKYNNDIDRLQSQQPSPNGDDKEFSDLYQNWVGENKWYTDDLKLRTYADGVADRLTAEGLTGRAYFSEITRQVKEDFSESFTNPNKSKAGNVEVGGQRAVGSKERSYENLPPDAKASCDGFVKDGFMTREDYVATYEFEEGGQ